MCCSLIFMLYVWMMWMFFWDTLDGMHISLNLVLLGNFWKKKGVNFDFESVNIKFSKVQNWVSKMVTLHLKSVFFLF